MNLRVLALLAFCLCLLHGGRASGAESSVLLDIEPTKDHPRNSEGSFAALKSGRLIFYYSQFYGGDADGSPCRIAGIESSDGGRAWSEPRVIVNNTNDDNVMSVSLLRLKDGRLALFYLEKKNWLDCRPYVRFSSDESATWSEPTLMVDAPGFFVMNNDRVAQLESGRLVAPVAFHRSKTSDPNSGKSFDPRAIALWYYSDDAGQTWKEAATWWAIAVRSGSGLQEPGVVELADGRLLSWARTDQGAQFGFLSADAGKTWTAPAPTELQSPTSPASIQRLPNSSRLLAIFNDHSGRFPFARGKRTPLVAAISDDDGKTWPLRKIIEDDPSGWFCYTAMHFTNDAVLLAYCAGDAKIGGLNRLRIRRISLDWLPAQ